MSALDEVVIDGRRTAKHYRTAQLELAQLRAEHDEARADNARLTARVAELERENKSITVSFLSEHDRADDLALRETWYNSEIERLHAALDAQPAVLTPRNCETCRKAAEAMREEAAVIAHKASSHIVKNAIDTKRNQIEWARDSVAENIEKDIRALPLPSFGTDGCAGCAPLKPE